MKLNDKQKAEITKGARMATARPNDKFADFWAEMTGDNPAVHGKRLTKEKPLIRSRH